MTATVALATLGGLVVGSFLNVLIARYGSRRSALTGRSACPVCGRRLAWWELIPIVSFFWLAGRCAGCRQPISWRYPVVELTTALGTGAIAAAYPAGLGLVALVFAFWIGVVITAIDLEHYLIPDRAVVLLAGAGLLWRLSGPNDLPAVATGLLGAGLGAGFLGGLVAVTRGRGMGLGDVKLGGALGWLLGWQLMIIALFGAFILGALVAVGLLAIRIRRLGEAIPFGPFLLIGAALAMIWGDRWYQWYVGL